MDRTTCAWIARLYDSRLQRGYVMGKLTNDPVYATTVAAIAGTQLPLPELGCGIGPLGQYLSAQGHRLPTNSVVLWKTLGSTCVSNHCMGVHRSTVT